MSFIWILVLALIVYLSRLIFLLPSIRIHLSESFKHFLSFASPCVLATIAAPIIFMPDGKLDLNYDNPFLIAGIVAVFLSYFTKSVLITSSLSIALFFLLKNI